MLKVWIIALTFVFPVLDMEVLASGSGPVEIEEGKGDQMMLAQNKRKRRKNRRKKKDPSGLDAGRTLHDEHEGKDAPYAFNVGLLSDFRIVNTTVGDADPVGSGEYFLSGRMLYIIAHSIEVGGDLEYGESTTKFEDSESSSSSYVLTLLAGYNFGNIDEDTMVFFVRGGFGFGSESSKSGEADEISSSLTRLTLLGGLHYFVDSNVALTTEIAYDSDTLKPDEGDTETTRTILHIARIGFTLFI